MPRPLRVHVPGAFYHVTLRGNHQQAIFAEETDRRLLNRIVARALDVYDTRLHAYCWMTNHLHLLMQVRQQPLGNPMRSIASEFAREMQKKLATTGHLFERRYHATLVDVDAYLLELVRYIHLNPVRARIATRPGDFPWSSHHVYVGARHEPWLTTDFALGMLGKDRPTAVASYRRFLEQDEGASWNPSQVSSGAARPLDAPDNFVPRPTPIIRARSTLEEVIAEACERFNVEMDHLASPVRDPYVSKVRAWIAHQALSKHVCSLAAVARTLKRHESTLREAMRAYSHELT